MQIGLRRALIPSIGVRITPLPAPAGDDTDKTTGQAWTYSAVNLGPFAGQKIVVNVQARYVATPSAGALTVTVDGVATTLLREVLGPGAGGYCGQFITNSVITSPSGDIVCTNNDAQTGARCCIAQYSIVNAGLSNGSASVEQISTGIIPTPAAVIIPWRGGAIAMAGEINGTNAMTFHWTGQQFGHAFNNAGGGRIQTAYTNNSMNIAPAFSDGTATSKMILCTAWARA